MAFYDLEADDIDRRPWALSAFKGQVALVVNTASRCGHTPQYAGLERLWQTYRPRGFVVLGFPSNDFGAQEPGSEADIKAFCTAEYQITFPLFAKVRVKGDIASPVYRFLTAAHPAPHWNFHKYLIGKDGRVKGSFGSLVQPDDPELRVAIESALG